MKTKQLLYKNTNLIVSDNGDILNIKTNRYLKQHQRKEGYIFCTIEGRPTAVHRLIALAFIPNPDNLATVNHKNGIKHDNRIENLEWLSLLDNIRHAYATGLNSLDNNGENNGRVKLNKQQALEIFNSCDTHRKLAKQYNISKTAVGQIKNKQRWKSIHLVL